MARPQLALDIEGLALAIRLRRARLDIGWSLAAAARAISMSEADLYALESGAEPVRASLLIRAARAYGAPLKAMLPGPGDLRLAGSVAALDASEPG